jgi:hypothetical protein
LAAAVKKAIRGGAFCREAAPEVADRDKSPQKPTKGANTERFLAVSAAHLWSRGLVEKWSAPRVGFETTTDRLTHGEATPTEKQRPPSKSEKLPRRMARVCNHLRAQVKNQGHEREISAVAWRPSAQRSGRRQRLIAADPSALFA